MKKRAVIFHPAIAPYRIDFFNSLSETFDASFYFEFEDPLEQSFDKEKMRRRLAFMPMFCDLVLWCEKLKIGCVESAEY